MGRSLIVVDWDGVRINIESSIVDKKINVYENLGEKNNLLL